MKKILLPVDGSERSEQSVKWVLSRYKPEDYELILMIVREDYDEIRCIERREEVKEETLAIIKPFAEQLKDFNLETKIIFGRAGEEIVGYANDNDIDMIVMTKSTKPGFIKMIGSVSTYVVKNANCVVVIVPENK